MAVLTWWVPHSVCTSSGYATEKKGGPKCQNAQFMNEPTKILRKCIIVLKSKNERNDKGKGINMVVQNEEKAK